MGQSQQYKGPFEGMDFEPYVYQHFPLIMRNAAGDERMVETEQEETLAEADGYKAPEHLGDPAVHSAQEVAALEATVADKDDEIAELKAKLAAALKPSPAAAAPK